jgi:hypothetical protein
MKPRHSPNMLLSMNCYMSRPAVGMCLMALPMTYPSAQGIMRVIPSPKCITIPGSVLSVAWLHGCTVGCPGCGNSEHNLYNAHPNICFRSNNKNNNNNMAKSLDILVTIQTGVFKFGP